jgi:uncharacterized protein YjbI with pentapeptide repeats
MSTPTQQEISNAKDNLSNYYDLMDDLQLDFTDIMNNLTLLLSNPTDDPGQSAMNGVITGLFDVFGIAAALSGMPAAGPIAGLGALITKAIVDDPPSNLHNQFASFQARFVKNIHDVQGKLGNYSANLTANWNLTITNPATGKSFKLSAFGKEGFVPGKKANLDDYNKYRARFRHAATMVSWKYFIPIVYKIGVRDDSHPDGPMSAYSCSDCWPTKDSAIQTFRDYINIFPASYFKILSFKDKCKSGGGTLTVYDYWTLGRGGSYASDSVCEFLFKDDGFGKIIHPNGLTTREEVFQKWGLKKKFLPGVVSYGSNCQLIHSKDSAALTEGQAPKSPAIQKASKDWSALLIDFEVFNDAKLKGANFHAAAGENILAQNADLERANFNEAKIAGADFRRANLRSATFVKADLGGADFRDADLSNVDFTSAFLRGADFSNANVDGAVFKNSDLHFSQGLNIKNKATLVLHRHQAPSPDKYTEISRLQKDINDLAIAIGLEYDIKSLTSLLEHLTPPYAFNYQLEAPLSKAAKAFSFILRTAGPRGARDIEKLMQGANVEKEAIRTFSSRCSNAFWPACGIRISIQEQQLHFEPFLSGPTAWPEVAAHIKKWQVNKSLPLETAVKNLDTQNIYLWGWDADETYNSIGLRIHHQNINRLDVLVSQLGLPAIEGTTLYSAIANSHYPAIVFVKSQKEKLSPVLDLYLPITHKLSLAPKLMDAEAKRRLKRLLELQKTSATSISALKYTIDGQFDGNQPLITAYF